MAKQPFLQGIDPDSDILVRLGEDLRKMPLCHVHRGLRLLNRNPQLQFPDGILPSNIVNARIDDIRHPMDYVNVRNSGAEQVKAGFENGHNGSRPCVYENVLSKHLGIAAEMALPELVTDQNPL